MFAVVFVLVRLGFGLPQSFRWWRDMYEWNSAAAVRTCPTCAPLTHAARATPAQICFVMTPCLVLLLPVVGCLMQALVMPSWLVQGVFLANNIILNGLNVYWGYLISLAAVQWKTDVTEKARQ